MSGYKVYMKYAYVTLDDLKKYQESVSPTKEEDIMVIVRAPTGSTIKQSRNEKNQQ